MADIIQLRRDTSSNWTSANPTLAQGELGVETNTSKIKVGDGSTTWSSLSYLIDTGSYVTASSTTTFTNKTLSSGVLAGVTTTASGDMELDPATRTVVIKGGGSDEGSIKLNCSANSHGQTITAQPHSANVTNTLLLPAGASSTLVSLVSTDTLTNKTLTSPKINENVVVSATATELNLLDGVTATTAEINYNDITTLGTSEASKVLTADANGDVLASEEFKAKSYNETYVAMSANDVDCEAGNFFSKTISSSTTFTFSNPPASDTGYGFVLKLTSSGTNTVTYPAAVDWAGGTAPDAPASGETDILCFITHDAGTTWYGFLAGDAVA